MCDFVSDDFHSWAKEQPQSIQDWIYNNAEDADTADNDDTTGIVWSWPDSDLTLKEEDDAKGKEIKNSKRVKVTGLNYEWSKIKFPISMGLTT